MPFAPLPRNNAKLPVKLRVHRQALIVFLEKNRHARPLVSSIKRPSRKIVRRDRLVVHLPCHPVNVANPPHPCAGPVSQSQRRILARQFAVARRKKLHFVQHPPISRRPRRKRQQHPQSKKNSRSRQLWPILRTPPPRAQYESRRNQ